MDYIKSQLPNTLDKIALNLDAEHYKGKVRDNYFNEESISSFDAVGKPKPEPDIYQRLIDIATLDKKETIVIEDSAIGIQAGVATGVKVIGLTAGKHWHKDRSDQELLDAGAYDVVKNYKDMLLLINKL